LHRLAEDTVRPLPHRMSSRCARVSDGKGEVALEVLISNTRRNARSLRVCYMRYSNHLCPEVFVAHRNSRLNVHGRRLVVRRVREEGWVVAQVAKKCRYALWVSEYLGVQ
jgi:hypothetical protein